MGATAAINTESLKLLFIAQKTLKIKTVRAAPSDPQNTCKRTHTGEARGAFAQILHDSAMIVHT